MPISKQVTHIAPPDAKGKIIGEPVVQEGLIARVQGLKFGVPRCCRVSYDPCALSRRFGFEEEMQGVCATNTISVRVSVGLCRSHRVYCRRRLELDLLRGVLGPVMALLQFLSKSFGVAFAALASSVATRTAVIRVSVGSL